MLLPFFQRKDIDLRDQPFRSMAHDFIEIAAVTDVGSVRQFNEDSIATDSGLGVAILADGMGGHRAGEVASQMATQIVMASLQSQIAEFRSNTARHSPIRAIEQSINRANRAVYDAARVQPMYQGMGTTVALSLFYDNRVALGHVGDSRVYRLRRDGLHLLTRDDSLLQDQVELGWIAAAEAGESHNRSLVTQALGIAETVSSHQREEEALPEDIYLLCSDGLNDLVEEADIKLIVSSLSSNLPLAASQLVQAAKDNGGYDNVSVILVRVLKAFPASSHTRWLTRLLGWFK